MKKIVATSILALVFSVSAQAGVKEVYDGGYKSSKGHVIYKIKCTSGSSYSAFKASDGYWKDGTGYNYGYRYRGLSLNEFASEKCS